MVEEQEDTIMRPSTFPILTTLAVALTVQVSVASAQTPAIAPEFSNS